MKKRFKTKTPSGRLVRFGALGATIKPGTPKGESYCTRSAGINRNVSSAQAKDPWTPNNLSRAMWGCYPGVYGTKSSLAKAKKAARRLVGFELPEWRDL